MDEFWLMITAFVVLLPLLLNALIDTLTGYLLRPLTHFAAFLGAIVCICAWRDNALSGTAFFGAVLSAICICCGLYLISHLLISRQQEVFLGRGDYRIIAVTSFLCALRSPLLAVCALWFAGILMAVLFAIIALRERLMASVTGRKKLAHWARSEKLINSPSAPTETFVPVKTQSKYTSRAAPMGLAIVTAAAAALFGSIAQS